MDSERKKAEQEFGQQTDLGGVIWRGEFGPFDRTPFLPNITLELCRSFSDAWRITMVVSHASVYEYRWWLLIDYFLEKIEETRRMNKPVSGNPYPI